MSYTTRISGKIWSLILSTLVNFVTIKWGTKYGPEYVNRLYKTLKNTYSGPFNFYCYTDNQQGLHSDIVIQDIKLLRQTPSSCFTIEKIFLFDSKFNGPVVLLDLDILVINDLSKYLNDYNFTEPRFIKNYWNDVNYGLIMRRFGRNWINSSFVTWEGDQLSHVVDFFNKNKQLIEYKFGDLDFFLVNTIRDQFGYHPQGIAYSYCDGSTVEDKRVELFREDHYIVLFNTSHGRGKELDQVDGWAREAWHRFD